MSVVEELAAIKAIRRVTTRYFRGVDTGDGELVRGILAEDCELDYRGCFTDPVTGRDFMPALNVVLRGRAAWRADGFAKTGIVSVHQGHHADIELTGAASARALWSMTDRLFLPAGAPFRELVGYGWYHESYRCVAGEWQIATLRIERIRIEGR